jgi:hypothetical protein
MNTRGRVLRDTSQGDGLISISGNQHRFSLERHWRSDVPPKTGMVVDVELTAEGTVAVIRAISEADLAREQAAKALQAAQGQGMALAAGITARFGIPVLVAWAAWLVATTLLSALHISVSAFSVAALSFWDLLGVINSSSNLMELSRAQSLGGLSKGIYALLFLAALVAPALPQFWRKPAAQLGLCGPLLMMIIACLGLVMALRSAANATRTAFAGLEGGLPPGSEAQLSQMRSQIMDAFHVDFGLYVAVAAALYLAFAGARGYLAQRVQAGT